MANALANTVSEIDPAVNDPGVTTQPLSQSVAAGGTPTFTVGASGTPTPALNWQLSINGGVSWFSFGPLTGYTFTTGPLTTSENGWEVQVVSTNSDGTAATNAATITVT